VYPASTNGHNAPANVMTETVFGRANRYRERERDAAARLKAIC